MYSTHKDEKSIISERLIRILNVISNLRGEETVEIFYEKELQKHK